MPGLAQRNAQFSNVSSSLYSSSCSGGPVSANGIWSKHRDNVTFDQLQKFWSELPPQARLELLKIDKQNFFEQARKNLYCSTCNGLLLESFSQIVMYGKSLQQEGAAGHLFISRPRTSKNCNDNGLNITTSSCQDDTHDPSVHPWGGLAATRDGILTLLDCFLDTNSLKALQNVFDSARARDRERELLYPDACGGGGRGWISQGMLSYGRGHGTRETCALHTARLSCDTLVDFWSALGDDTRQSLLWMKEEDFIERLVHRGNPGLGSLLPGFDSKRFCRDCRRNVIREFKELKRMRREPRCTSWFCVADTAFQYEVSDDTVQADWHQSFIDTVGTYHHFEWAVGTGEGKYDILDFEDVGMNGNVQVNGLDLGGLSECFITLRAWKLDARFSELSVKAHALKGQQCVHRRLIVEDGYVTITKGESIRRFFEHAEEAEEEEDDDSMDNDGNELDGEGSHPQKHAKSPELAREFLLDAAIVIFKEQALNSTIPNGVEHLVELEGTLGHKREVEKAFREGTARQNAHSIFVSLALKLLEERVHVACKEIITLEKQIKLLEEEEKEKREEEERKERRRTKEREKKLRRKERLKGKERDRENKCSELKQIAVVPENSSEESSPSVHEETINTISSGDSVSETGYIMLSRPLSPDIQDEPVSNGCIISKMQDLKSDNVQHLCNIPDWELGTRDENVEESKSFCRKLRFRKELQLKPSSKWCDRRRSAIGNNSGVMVDESEPRSCGGYLATSSRHINGVNRQSRSNAAKPNARNCRPKFGEKFYCSNYRMHDRYDSHSCNCTQHSDNRAKDGPHVSVIRSVQEIKTLNNSESVSDVSRPFYRNNKCNNVGYMSVSCGIPKNKLITGPPSRDLLLTKKVWEPMESRKKYPRSNSESDVTLGSSTFKIDDDEEGRCDGNENGSKQPNNHFRSSDDLCSYELSESSGKISGLNCHSHEDNNAKESRNSTLTMDEDCQNGFGLGEKTHYYSKEADNEEDELCPNISLFPMNSTSDPNMNSTSSSDNCSSCLSEGNSSTASSSTQNVESLSTSDSEDASPQSEGRETSVWIQNGVCKSHDVGVDGKDKTNGGESFRSWTSAGFPQANCVAGNFPGDPPTKNAHNPYNGRIPVDMGSQQHHMNPPMHNQSIHLPVFPAPSTVGYYHQNIASWSAAHANWLMPFHQPNRYLFTSPFEYGVSASRPSHFCMQYGALQPLTTPVRNVGHLPVYQPVSKANGGTSKEQTENSKLGGSREALNGDDAVVSERYLVRPVQNDQAPPDTPSHGEGGQAGNSARLHNESTNFSLFHFGGPIAMAGGYNLNPVSLKEGMVGDFSLNSPADHVEADLACNKKETGVEEYSLFAASNGTRFSIF
ncbi:hypothetical protein HHK36_017646 [Tetracentron sinense]|uniref:Stress response protein NST1 n=1 Tax=Tetracentron sinense TaxID=13715 RepID=A0A835DD96_TETSI|nr:hypothetical protein HHK36_017646 [Tetracentron sinense]